MTLDSRKTHTFYDEDILRYMYAEMSEDESSCFDDQLVSNLALQNRYEELLSCAELLVVAMTNNPSDALTDLVLMQTTGKQAWRDFFLAKASLKTD